MVAIAKLIVKMQKKSGVMKSGLDAMPLFLLDNLLSRQTTFQICQYIQYCNLLLRKYLQEHSSSNLRGFIQALNALINYKNGHFQSFKLKYVLNLNGMKFGCKLLLLLGWPFFLYLKLFLIGVQMLSKIYAHSLSKKFSPPE